MHPLRIQSRRPSPSLIRILHSIDIKEVCNCVIQPVTKVTIMKYTKLMNDPVLSPNK
jgi:hypothetical protein